MKFIVSLTTIPSKVKYIHQTLQTLFQQTVPPSMVLLHVPRAYTMRWGGQVIDECELDRLNIQFPSLVIHRVDHDDGPGTKLLGLLRCSNVDLQDTHVVLVDDDLLYNPRMLEWFKAYTEKYPDIKAASFYYYLIGNLRVGQGADGFIIHSDVLEGFLAYFDRIKDQDYVLYHDDIYISYYLWRQGVFLYHLHPPTNIYHKHAHTMIDALSTLQGKYSRSELKRRVPQLLHDVFHSDHIK